MAAVSHAGWAHKCVEQRMGFTSRVQPVFRFRQHVRGQGKIMVLNHVQLNQFYITADLTLT